MGKVIFLDRDDTILIDSGYMYNPSDIKFCKGAIKGMQLFIEMDFELNIVTNQSGVGRGIFTKVQFKKFNRIMLQKLNNHGINIKNLFVCFHHPNDNCICRKPKTGMLKQYLMKNKFKKQKSYMIGDKISDVDFGNRLEINSIIIYQNYEKECGLKVVYSANNLIDAAGFIKKDIL